MEGSGMVLLLVPVLLVSQHAAGLQVEVFEGEESVLLPCWVPVNVSRGSTSVWDRDDFRIPTVHVREPDGDYLKDQNQRYAGRTSMMEDALQTGDLSLTLSRPTFTDSGTFTCTVRRLGEDLHSVNVDLQVKEPPSRWPWVLLGLVVLLILLVVPAVVWYCLRKKKLTAVVPPETVEIREGVKSVLLPFKTSRGLPQDVKVEWTRLDPSRGNITIHVFENGRSEHQENIPEGQTKMKADLLSSGDLSLTLRTPQLKDSGDYQCVVSRGGDRLRKTVTLKVKESLMEEVEVADREENVRLPFNTAAHLPQDAKVVWKRTDRTGTVYEFQNGQNQSDGQNPEYLDRTEMNPDALGNRDLTLTLKDPSQRDSGVFICTVYNADGKILGRKVVTLTVKVYKVEKVSVEEGTRSVVLPFRTAPRLLSGNVTVEWRLADVDDMMLYTYDRGQHRPTQDQTYGGHTKMNEDLLTTGDLSLTLSDLRLTQSVYTCSIHNEGEEILQQKVVVLIVRALQVEVVEVTKGEPSVSLPFKIPLPVDEDIKVEWTHPGSRQPEVITFENGEVQVSKWNRIYRRRTKMDGDLLRTGDLSLVLKRPCVADNGLYKCMVYKGQEVQQQKMVTLSVREHMESSFNDRIPSFKRRRTASGSPHEHIPLDSSINQD
ncbi:uncharacterized protein V3H82_013720 isoform 3-T3 [Fundulus diaphanus]